MLEAITIDHIIQIKVDLFEAKLFDTLVLSEKQIEALQILTDEETDELLFGGAAGGGKTWTACEWLLWSCLSYPETRWFVGRHHLSQIRESTIETFKKVCKKHEIPQSYWKYNDQTVKITFKNGSVIKGLEMMHKPGDADFDGFGSTEYTGGLIEEGGGVASKAYEVAKTRIGRHYNDRYGIRGKLLVTGNPSRNWMYTGFYKPSTNGTLDPKKKFVRSLATDNNFREAGYLERLQQLSGQMRQRLLLGNWEFINDPNQLIENDAIQDLFTNDFIRPDRSKRRLVLDVAMRGKDLLRGAVFYGNVLVDHAYMVKSGGAQVLKFAKDLQAKHGIPASSIIYDSDGVGAFLGGQGGFIPGAIPFHGNAAPFIINREETKRDQDARQKQVSEYANLKAQCAWLLAYEINEGKMWAQAVTEPTDQEMLSDELAQIKEQPTGDGKLRLVGKDDVKQALGRSPDFSDLLIMLKYFDLLEMSGKKKFKRPVAAM